jgi:hypothetical protein
VNDAKALLHDLRLSMPMVLRTANKPEINEAAFRSHEALNRSTPKIIAHLDRIRPLVQRIDEPLKPYFGGESALARLDVVKRKLEQADATQEVSIKDASLETLQLWEAKGRLLELIEDLNRTGRMAFRGRAELIGRFNKDLLLRARLSRTGTAAPEAGEAPVSEVPRAVTV